MYDQAQETKWARARRAVEAKSVPQPADRADPPNDAPKKRVTRQKRLLTLVIPEPYPNGTHGVTTADVSVRVADERVQIFQGSFKRTHQLEIAMHPI